jgi:steroid 5-alpha reductase family enzyme/uncharacterized membrane protein
MLAEIFISTISVLLSISILGFILSRYLKRNDIADIIWGLGILTIVFFQINSFNTLNIKAMIVFCFLVLWSLRLSSYTFIRILNSSEDKRYLNMRRSWGDKEPFHAFFKVFFLQSVLMGIISFPISLIITGNPSNITPYDFLAVILFILGILFETIGDAQLYFFKKKNKGKICTEGLRKLTRHPNYFGEILIWWSFFVFTINVEYSLYSILSPILLTFLIIKVSGISLLENNMKKKSRLYQDYISTTPSLIPISKLNLMLFFKTAFIVIVLDFLWLGLLLNDYYIKWAKNIALISDNKFDYILWGAIGVYILIPMGVIVFALNKTTRLKAVFNAALFGLILYGVYEFTNIALIKNWPIELAIVDIIWGPTLCGLTAFFSYSNKNPINNT